MTASYRVTVTAGPHDWETRRTADPDLPEPAAYGLADPITITRSLPDVDLFPAQPNPATATFNVIVEEANLTLAEHDPVAIRVFMPFSGEFDPVETFYGRITDIEITPHQLGALYSITCVDYLVDYVEDEIEYGFVIGFDLARVNTLIEDAFDRLDLPSPFPAEAYDGDTTPDGPYMWVTTEDLDVKASEHIEFLLRQWILHGDARGRARYVVDQNIGVDGLPDTDQPFKLVLAFRNIDPDGNDYMDVPDPEHMTVIDGAYVELGSRYTLRKRDGIRRIIVKPDKFTDTVKYVATIPGLPKPTARIDTIISGFDQDSVDRIGDFYLPDDVPRNRWAADTFRWLIYGEPDRRPVPALGSVVSISPIQVKWNPTGNTWFTGRLVRTVFTISGGRPVVDLDLRDTAS